MKKTHKRAYTLAETLVALGVVGILAALTLPMINKIKPDTTMISYLRIYDSINEAVDSMVNNQMLYPLENTDEPSAVRKTLQYNDYPLYNTTFGVDNDVLGLDISAGSLKFCEALATSFGVPNDKVTCNNNVLTGTSPSFTLKDGTDFIVKTETSDPTPENGKWYGTYRSKILIDFDGLKNGKNSTYSSTVKNPDRFVLVVYSDGRCLPDDDKGRGYLSKRMDVRKSNSDVTNYNIGKADSKWEKFELAYIDMPEDPTGPTPTYWLGTIKYSVRYIPSASPTVILTSEDIPYEINDDNKIEITGDNLEEILMERARSHFEHVYARGEIVDFAKFEYSELAF